MRQTVIRRGRQLLVAARTETFSISAAMIVAAIAWLSPAPAYSQSTGVDPEAARILKRMTDYLGSLPRFAVDTANSLEVALDSGQKLQFLSANKLTVQRPDMFLAERVGDLQSQSFYYDGSQLTVFNPDDGYYATVKAPDNIDKMIDFARDTLDIVSPAGDLITTDAYQRMMADATSGIVVGKSMIRGVRCDHIAFRGYKVDWQLWIEDGAKALPRRFVITTLDLPGAPQVEVEMNSWTTTPDVSAGRFEFSPPPGSRQVDFLPIGNAGVQP